MLLTLVKDLIGGVKAPAEDVVIHRARELFSRSLYEEAIALLTDLIERRPTSVAALMLRGTAKRETGRVREAMDDFVCVERLAPDAPDCFFELAACSYLLGDRKLALEYCERGRRVAPDWPQLFALMAQIKLDGEVYFKVLARILEHLKPRSYVEIGVFEGDSLRLAQPLTRAIGIDPEPRLTSPLRDNQRVFAETSDAFFANHDLRAELGGLPVDLAFIDGMHHFEFALRDFANLERHCTRQSTILIHDCYPLDRESADRRPRSVNWSGDIWRLIVLLKKYRPDLRINVIGTPPTGLGVVQNLDPASRFLMENHDRLYEEFLALDYSYLDSDTPQKLNLFPNDWVRIRTLFEV
jgi:hypothetical protein